MHQDLHFYIDLDWRRHIEMPQNYLKEVIRLVDFVYQHQAKVYYSHTQLLDFTKNCGDLEENFVVSFGSKLEMIVNKSTALKEQNYVFEVCFAQGNTSLNHIDNPVLSSLLTHSKQIILSSSLSINSLLLVKSNSEFKQISLGYVNDIKGIREWIITNSAPRNFNLSPKHGENGTGNWKGESVLLCDESTAQEFLQTAIADYYMKNRLFNWDENYNTFIEFFFEGGNPQNQWHGFHLEKIDWKRVPVSIQKFFSK